MTETKSSNYGLRSTYRLAQTDQVVSRDFTGPTKGQDSEDFLKSIRGQEDFNVTSIFMIDNE